MKSKRKMISIENQVKYVCSVYDNIVDGLHNNDIVSIRFEQIMEIFLGIINQTNM